MDDVAIEFLVVSVGGFDIVVVVVVVVVVVDVVVVDDIFEIVDAVGNSNLMN